MLANEYEKCLLDELGSTINAVNDQQELIDNIYKQVAYHQNIVNQCNGSWDQLVWSSRLDHLKTQQQEAIEMRNQCNEDKVENESQLMEQLFVTRKMRDEYVQILKKHEGHASRVIGDAMNANGVDENVYHKRSIDGNKCMKFGENGSKIVDQVDEEMKKHIKDEKNVQYLNKLSTSLKEILRLWYKLMLVMKSVKRQPRHVIAQFKVDTIALNEALHDFVTNEPVPGTGNKLPQFLKSHLLFDYHIQDFFELWESLGGFDEQSIESTHPIFNQLLRQYGNTRGRSLKRQVIRQFLFKRASFIAELMDEMVEKSSKKKRIDTKKRGPEIDDSVLEEEEETSRELSSMEKDMNANYLLRPVILSHPVFEKYPDLDTCISACKHCGKRLINFGADIHYHEYHSGAISNELDDVVVERMKEEAAL
jgi:hypothetical protein